MTVTLDSDRIVGAILSGGRGITVHAVMKGENGQGRYFYCRPSKQAEAVDMKADAISCELCKAKLKRELTTE